MKRLRLLVALSVGSVVVLAGGPDPAVAGKARPRPSAVAVGTITGLSDPMTRQVVQRRDDNFGTILVVGAFQGKVDGFQARTILRPGMAGRAQDWAPLGNATIAGGAFLGSYRQAAGGFYDMQVRPTYQGRVGDAVTVFAVGVGEVFITAGQSNSTNCGNATGFAPDVRVSSLDGGPSLGMIPTLPNAAWRWGVDPQPVVDGSLGGSVWPIMADHLTHALGVPVGLYNIGYLSTPVASWLPGAVVPAAGATPALSHFTRLTTAINYFKVRGGVRAVLWDQGESDIAFGTPAATYEASLRTIIAGSRAATGVPIRWMVAQATGTPNFNPARQSAQEKAQAAVTDGVLTFLGPNTDLLGDAYRQAPPTGLAVHFNAVGVQTLGTIWGIKVVGTTRFLDPGFLPAD